MALVTGGGVRLGRAIALGLAGAGHDLLVHYNRSEEPAAEVVAAVRALGRRAEAVSADLSTPEGAERVARAVEEHFGRLDLLVNSAASFDQAKLLEVDPERWDSVMDLNLRGPFLVARALAPLLTEARGSVVNMVDLSAFQPWVRYPHHGVSKAGLMHLTRVLARVLAPAVRVNAIAPGAVLPPDDASEAELEREIERTPLARIGSPDDIVRTVLFLTASPFVTGQVVVVDGGRSLEFG
ncbi:SDR family oxidoreductase [Gemmatimonadota bacterium Y43]|uniref:SDR family oxidoreductase n=1 Tax=Gaopeijia maritima TaxID=3119007 RepID=UPI003290F5E6